MELECTLFNCGKECELKRLLKIQSQKGGTRIRNGKKGVGKYWTKVDWEGFVYNTNNLSTQGCADAEGVRKLAETLTQEKTNKGEIVD